MIKTDEQRMLENILHKLDPNQKIYRVISIKRFFELIEDEILVLIKPYKWNDPFEDLLSKTVTINSKGEHIGFNITKDYYGQCWTLREECDGIWRNYASLDNGVRIETTVKQLLTLLFEYEKKWQNISCFIGKVEYLSESEILSFLQDSNFIHWVTDTTGKNPAKTLLIKRKEFQYEKEVRLLYASRETTDKGSILPVKINPKELFQSFCFAPKTPHNLYKMYKQNLENRGYDSSMIFKSKLYEPYQIKITTDSL
jgi:hypothetical protein